MEIVAGFDLRTEQYADFPVYKDFRGIFRVNGDTVVIDFTVST